MQEKTQEIKERYVLNKFTEYPYHELRMKQIQEDLASVSRELSYENGCQLSPWKQELLYKEEALIQELKEHVKQIMLVDSWLKELNENHRNIMRTYAIAQGCKEGCRCARLTNNTESNVYKTTKRVIQKIARKLP